MEEISKGQQIAQFDLLIENADGKTETITGTTIGHKRIVCFPERSVKKITLQIKEADGKAIIKKMAAFKLDSELLVIDRPGS